MPRIFNALPGAETPVEDIAKSLARMWEGAAPRAGEPAAEFRATQMNLVLHFGFQTTPEDALAQFRTAVAFAQRYPCRVLVLCPLFEEQPEAVLRAKIYGECFFGKSGSDTRCCEFVMLSYPQALRGFLENQVSVCLENDLPLYYWTHRFSSSIKLNDYQYLLRRSLRVLLDSASAPADALTFPWPRREALRDLAAARLLPVRQSLGQFLSRYPMALLAGGLRTVAIAHDPAHAAEARALLAWARARLERCGGENATFTAAPAAGGAAGSLELKFTYDDRRQFNWKADFGAGRAFFEADFGAGRTALAAPVSLLSAENALAEAIFF